MAISKASWDRTAKPNQTRVRTKITSFEQKAAILLTTFLNSVWIMSVFDLLLAYIRNDSLVHYTMSVLLNLVLTILGLIVCSDLILAKKQDFRTSFLAYMIFLWVCMAVLKLVFIS
ncbi:hypothetical protein Desor_2822 [Desulfosporosinus orientis DSM 765]|uniref:Uncharacterized protein n=1 Tax=Desulfosporosinus orientis (strain ATCC 19365 / DSM 765 / NCIMB 8382 / VKM B-1628 / Singapore I) TaxID=768706 RepID=G7WDN5_DESOD|nr:hypothetical protein [Desulfosporosinus orientis]AET68360.1 hypothetical protein Desor_2822 [Desulfosporosinus orientis DSM 765]